MKVPDYFSVNRNTPTGTYKIAEVFSGLEKIPALRKAFKNKLNRILKKTKVKVTNTKFYFWTDNKGRYVDVSKHYLKNGELWTIYLDIIHELIHVKQFYEGKKLYDTRFDYISAPIEIEAYCVAVREAKRIGATKKQICYYLKVPWITRTECAKLFEKVC